MLPKPSYDIWEIHWGVHTYTIAMVYSALKAGAQLAESMKYEHLIESCTDAADEIKDAYGKYFFDEKDGTFINSIYCDPQHTKSRIDKLSDTSIHSLWMVQYYLKVGNKTKASKYLDWVTQHTDHTGLMAEQAHPHTGFGLSMKPLTWSHSEFVRTLNMI